MRAKRREVIKLSSRMLLVFLAISLCVGIGVGYAIKDNKAGASDSDVMDQITDLSSTVEQLQSQVSSLTTDLEDKRSEYDALSIEYNDTSEKLTLLEENHQALMNEYDDLMADFGTYITASENATVVEVVNLQEQVSSLQDRVGTLQSDNFWLDVEIARLNKLLTPSPDHALKRPDVWEDETLWSHAWKMRDYELQLTLEEIAQQYYSTHTYYEGETDCNDMAVDLWNMLLTQDIKSVIVVGNRDMTGETLEESDHAWLYAFNADGKVIYVEPTTGEVFYGKLPDGTTNPKAVSYREGFMYRQPSDLRKDLKEWW
ncbi:MAG: hypothetical protein HQ553_03695 [Chloroflexi bacterium]|nr:hypothetical protein [Chloroflexota bacterium]